MGADPGSKHDKALADVQGKLAELIKASPHLIVADERLRGMTEVTLAWRAKKANDPAKAEEYLRRAAALVN